MTKKTFHLRSPFATRQSSNAPHSIPNESGFDFNDCAKFAAGEHGQMDVFSDCVKEFCGSLPSWANHPYTIVNHIQNHPFFLSVVYTNAI